MKIRTSITIPELTLEQLKNLQDFYENPEILGDKMSLSRLITICVAYFWNHIFNENKI